MIDLSSEAGAETSGQTRRSRRSAARRQELLQAALAVIRTVGPSASMDQMAAEAGITKPVLYRYFGDRDGLIRAVAESFAEDLAMNLMLAVGEKPDASPEESIRLGIEAYICYIEKDPALYGFLTQHAAPDSQAIVAVVDRVAEPLAAVIGDRLSAADLDPTPAAIWAYGVIGMVHMAGARWVRQPEFSREQLISYLVSLASYGLATGGQPVQPDL